MTVTERIAYIKGLYEGLGFDPDSKEAKLLHAMLDAMEDMARTIAHLEEENDALQEVMDTILEDVYDNDDSYDEEEDDDFDGLDIDTGNELYQVICPSCGEEIYVDEDTLDLGNVSCPACGEDLEFDLSALELQADGLDIAAEEPEDFDDEPEDEDDEYDEDEVDMDDEYDD